ncbi:MAG: branched-chain amino acid ABC transporter permease [Anaerolineae bacterium]|nr:branched-chain amino acid ABC transporter permease [Anaerolineae bacterium]MDQ7035703.1 branched-chain amino acid ABC transporter permease [Anaerolineae bacterium]
MNIDYVATTIAVLTFFGIWSLMAISLNIEYGVAGIPNFGKALFVSIGAYTTGVTYTRLLPILAGRDFIHPCGSTLADAIQLRSDIIRTMPVVAFVNFGITLVIAAVISGIIGFAFSYLVLRLKEEWFLALVLLVGGEIVRIFVRGYQPLICANNGISAVSQPFAFMGGRSASIAFLMLVLLIAFIAYVYSERLIRSPYGRLLKAIRENEDIARTLGKDVAKTKAQVMFIGSMIAAISGVLFAVNLGFVNTNDYVVTLTLDVWVMVVLGGLGNPKGALLGAFVIAVLDRLTAIAAIQMNMAGFNLEFNFVRFILFAVILLLMMRYRPQGILPEPNYTTEAHDNLTARTTGD